MFQIIKPDSSYDFLGWRSKAFIVSAVLILGSIGLVAIKGFNFGIDFKGGSSAIVAFKKGAVTDRDAIGAAVTDMLTGLSIDDSQVSVQDFGAGTGDTLNGEAVDRFLIYSEVTSLVGDAKRELINKRFTERFGEGTRVATSDDAGDRFYVSFENEVDIVERSAAIREILASDEIGFNRVDITSDIER